MAKMTEARQQAQFRKREEYIAALHKVGDRATAVLAEGLETERLVLDRTGKLRSLGPDQPERRQSALAILDRIGVGPTSNVEVDVDASIHLLHLIKTLDGDDRPMLIEVDNEA